MSKSKEENDCCPECKELPFGAGCLFIPHGADIDLNNLEGALNIITINSTPSHDVESGKDKMWRDD